MRNASLLASVAILLSSSFALAEDDERPSAQPWANKGELKISVNMEAALSSTDIPGQDVFKPFSISPDVYYGINKRLTVWLLHSARSLVLPSAGGSLCLSGEDGGCSNFYRNVELGGAYSLLTAGRNKIGLAGGIGTRDIDPFQMNARVGVPINFGFGSVDVLLYPWMQIGITNRQDDMDAPINEEFLAIPARIEFRVLPELRAHLISGVNGQLDGFGDTYEVPIGVGITYEIAAALAVGAQFALAAPINGKDQDVFDENYLLVNADLNL